MQTIDFNYVASEAGTSASSFQTGWSAVFSPEAENTQGILAARKGDAEMAKYHFKKSAAGGLDAAEYNLQELLNNQ